MKWTIRIKRTSTSCIYDSKLTCYNVVFIHNLVAKSHACNARVPYSSLNGVCVCVVRVEVQIVFFWYTLSLFFWNFKPRLVMLKIEASVSVYRTAKLPPLQPAPCYPEIFKIYLCLIVLRQLPPSQPVPCYSKITTRAKTPTSCEIPTREMPVVPLNRKNRLKSVGVLS